jgi:stress response protein YsnF
MMNATKANFPENFHRLYGEIVMEAEHEEEDGGVSRRGLMDWTSLQSAYDMANAVLKKPGASRQEFRMARLMIEMVEHIVCNAYVEAFGKGDETKVPVESAEVQIERSGLRGI